MNTLSSHQESPVTSAENKTEPELKDPHLVGGNILRVLSTESRLKSIYDFIQKYIQLKALDDLGDGGVLADIDFPDLTLDELTFLQSPLGRQEIQIWREAFKNTISALDVAVGEFNRGADFTHNNWLYGVEALDRTLQSLVARVRSLDVK